MHGPASIHLYMHNYACACVDAYAINVNISYLYIYIYILRRPAAFPFFLCDRLAVCSGECLVVGPVVFLLFRERYTCAFSFANHHRSTQASLVAAVFRVYRRFHVPPCG